MMQPKLIIFDCDGVLVDSEPVTADVMAGFFTDRGLPLNPQEANHLFVGGTLLSAGEEAARRGAKLEDAWFETLTRTIHDRLREGVALIPGVADIIDAAERAGIKMAVVSNGPMPKMEITLAPHGLLDRFAGRIFFTTNRAEKKPAPFMVNAAMAQAGVSAEETVMIDDSASGCLAAHRAGVRCFGFATEGQDEDLRAVGAEVVHDMADIHAALEL